MSIIDTIIDLQHDYYKKHKRAVSLLCLNKHTYDMLLRELDTDELGNLHGMQIIINSKLSLKLI